MLYCFNAKHFSNNDRTNKEIEYAINKKLFIYYDEEENVFKDELDNIVDVHKKEVFPVSFIFQLPALIEALTKNGAIIPNTIDKIHMVEEWYNHIVTKRNMISFPGSMLNDPELLTYIYEVFGHNPEVFLKTAKKDYNGIIDLTELYEEESDLRKAIKLHEDEEFILSEKVEVNEDEIGKEEYRIFIYQGRIMNISRITDTTYHTIPEELIEYVEELLTSIPRNFPKSFVLDVFSYGHMYDILECNPIEASGRYLYNSVFSLSQDLTHTNIESIPEEKDSTKVSYSSEVEMKPSTLVKVQGSFAKDYDDIKRYGKRVEGFVHIYGLPEGIKIDLDSLLSSITTIDEDSKLEDTPIKRLTPNS